MNRLRRHHGVFFFGGGAYSLRRVASETTPMESGSDRGSQVHVNSTNRGNKSQSHYWCVSHRTTFRLGTSVRRWTVPHLSNYYQDL